MESLQTRRVAKVGCVRVGGQREVSISRICHGKVGREVVETSVVSYPDEGDPLQEFLCVVGIGEWCVFDKDEAMLFL